MNCRGAGGVVVVGLKDTRVDFVIDEVVENVLDSCRTRFAAEGKSAEAVPVLENSPDKVP